VTVLLVAGAVVVGDTAVLAGVVTGVVVLGVGGVPAAVEVVGATWVAYVPD